jgi:hypothetical protein
MGNHTNGSAFVYGIYNVLYYYYYYYYRYYVSDDNNKEDNV